MVIPFTKFQGTGNDFIIVDNRSLFFPKEQADLIPKLTHRKFGIGADGFMLIEAHAELDFMMHYYNADGSQSLCGNGSRCAVMYAHQLGIIDNETLFETTDGIHRAVVEGDKVSFQLHDIKQVSRNGNDFFIYNGSPHHINYVADVEQVDVVNTGRDIRYADRYAPDGTNVNFVSKVDTQMIKVRTYERGVENETLSCGTGVTAAAITASFHEMTSPILVETLGGTLEVSFEKVSDSHFSNVYLKGPAQKVFEGEITV